MHAGARNFSGSIVLAIQIQQPKGGECAMQAEGPHRRCCRLDPIRDELSPQAAERFCNACRPHQALGQAAPMQAHNKNFDQSALAA